MKVEQKGDKWIFNKDGVYFALTLEQAEEMHGLLTRIILANHLEQQMEDGMLSDDDFRDMIIK